MIGKKGVEQTEKHPQLNRPWLLNTFAEREFQ